MSTTPLPPSALSPFSPIPLQVFNNWMDQTMDDLKESFVCSTIEDVEELQREHEEYKAGALQEANTNYEELNSLVTQMAELGGTDNPYTTLNPQVHVGHPLGRLAVWTVRTHACVRACVRAYVHC